MTNVEECINSAVTRAISMRAREVNDVYVETWYNSFLINTVPIGLVTHDGFAMIRESVFSDEQIRDFILSTSSFFMTYMGLSAEGKYDELISNLRNGFLDVDETNSEYVGSMIPEQISNRLMDESTLIHVLKYNKWYTTMLVMLCYASPIVDKKHMLGVNGAGNEQENG